MSDTVLATHKKWRDELIYHLRLKDIPGDRIGDILLEIDSHVRESGETPEQAFGSPKTYASSRIVDARDRQKKTGSLIGIGLLSGIGSFFYAYGAVGVGEGAKTVTALDLNPWIPLLAGLIIIAGIVWWLPFDFVRHPSTHRPLFGDAARNDRLKVFIGVIVLGFLLALLGRGLA